MDANYDAVLVALTEHGAPANEVEVCRLIFERYLGDGDEAPLPIWTDIGLLEHIETEAPPMDPDLEEQILRATKLNPDILRSDELRSITEAIYDRLGIIRSSPDILSRDELRRIVEESDDDERETDT